MSQKIQIQKTDIIPIRKQLMQDLKEFIADLDKTPEKYLKGIHFNKNYTLEETVQKQTIYITSSAYLQMLQYVLQSSKEIAWHCLVQHPKDNEYVITKCLLYPQTVTGATVTTDQTKYNAWVQDLDDETFNSMKCQAHSHVNMSVSPSTVDLGFYEDLVASLPKDSYYIFLILNKQQAIHAIIYDKAHNMLYTKEDIEVVVLDSENEHLMDDINADIKQYVSEYTPIGFGAYKNTYSYPTTYPTKQLEDPDYWDKFYDELENDLNKKHTKSLKQVPRLKNKKRK